MIPPHERRVLEAHVRGVRAGQLAMHQERDLNEYEKRELKELIRLRMKGIPLQYLVSSQDFYGREFYVNSGVLIPRPETEGLVEHTLKRLPEPHSLPTGQRLNLLDFGTGSGCIGLTLALERHDAFVWATEASGEAMDVATENARRHRAASYEIVRVFDPPVFVQYESMGHFDAIVANPPYLVPADDISAEVREFEPPEALFTPEAESPLFYYEFLAELCARQLKPTGFAALEIAENRAEETAALFRAKGFGTEIHNDLPGRPRYLLCTRR